MASHSIAGPPRYSILSTMALPDDRVPTLVQYCQRVAAVHVDGSSFPHSSDLVQQHIPAISSLGDELRYELVRPILQRCTVDQLLRLEQASPVSTTLIGRPPYLLFRHTVFEERHTRYVPLTIFKRLLCPKLILWGHGSTPVPEFRTHAEPQKYGRSCVFEPIPLPLNDIVAEMFRNQIPGKINTL